MQCLKSELSGFRTYSLVCMGWWDTQYKVCKLYVRTRTWGRTCLVDKLCSKHLGWTFTFDFELNFAYCLFRNFPFVKILCLPQFVTLSLHRAQCDSPPLLVHLGFIPSRPFDSAERSGPVKASVLQFVCWFPHTTSAPWACGHRRWAMCSLAPVISLVFEPNGNCAGLLPAYGGAPAVAGVGE